MDFKYYKSDFNLIVTIGAEYMNSQGETVTLDNTANFVFRFYTSNKNNPYICSSTGGATPMLVNCSKLDNDKVVCHFDRSLLALDPGQLYLEAEFIVPDNKFEGDDIENVVRLYSTNVVLTIDPDKDTEGEFEVMIGADFIQGSDGKSAYESAVEGGYEGTEEEFYAALTNVEKANRQVSITYMELFGKLQVGKLIPGQYYRITNYVTKTTSSGTQSAGHQFDVIVRADSENVLNENAFAALHTGDTYFQNCKLEAWKIKYDIHNDTNRFAWADANNGKGVIYHMVDEWGNEAPYDFKNIMFARYKISNIDGEAQDLRNQYLGFFDIDNPSVMYPSGATLTGNAVYRYTFDVLNGTTSSDSSVLAHTQSIIRVHDNVIHPYFGEQHRNTKLNNITIGGTSYAACYENEFLAQDRNWAIAGGAYGNRIGVNSYNNSVGEYFQNNTVGNNFYYNTVGEYFRYNSVGNSFGYNTVGNSFDSNTVGQSFRYNTVGNGFYSNTVGNNFYYNTVGNNFYYNSVGNWFYNNSVGNGFSSNNVGVYFQNNTVGNSFDSNTVGNCCYSNTFADEIYGANFIDGISGRNIAPVGLDTFDYDYGSWIEGDEDEDGDTLVSGMEDGYFEITFSDEQQHSCHLVVGVRHAGGTEVLFDQDITTDSDGVYRIENLEASWDECKGNLCCYSVEAVWTDDGITQRRSDYSSY